MPRLSQYFVKSALICLVIGFGIGGLILASKATPAVSPLVWAWFPAHIIILLDGWLVQLAIGVAYWILPRILGSERGRTRWAWASFGLLQTGLALVIVSLLQMWWPPARSLVGIGAGLHALALLAFAVHAWPRVRAAVVRPSAPAEPQPQD
jgi:heme/copper-type cytochrome/quinol oxidase subunit 1